MEPLYQIIAIAPPGDQRATRKLQIQLEEAFDLDLSTVMEALVTTGVCISTTHDPAEAKRVGRTANKLGADVLLLDEQERVLADSRKKSRPPVTGPHGAVPQEAGTELDLDNEPTPEPVMEVQPVAIPLAIAPSEVSDSNSWMEDKAASAVMEEVKPLDPEPIPAPAPQLAPAPEAQPAPAPVPQSDAQAEAPSEANPAAAFKGSGSFNLDALSVEELVSLDGGLTRSSRSGASRSEAEDFQNPFEVQEEAALELDNVPLPAALEDEFADSTGNPHQIMSEDVFPDEQSSAGKKAAAQKRSVTGPGFPAVKPSVKAGPSARERATEAARSAMASPMVKATGAAAQKAADAASEKAALVVDVSSGLVVRLKDVFAQRRRVRIVLGMIIAIGLGGIIPAVHARTAFDVQFKPLLQELSNAQALAQRGDDLPEYRKPESVSNVLSTLKLRYFAFTATLWSALAGLLAFIWFRIT